MVVVAALGHRLLHVTLGTESSEVIFPVSIEGTLRYLVHVVHLKLTFCPTLGASPFLLLRYLHS